MVANRFSTRELRRCNCDEIVEIVIDDGRATEAGRVILKFQRRGVVPLAIKWAWALGALIDPFNGSINAYFQFIQPIKVG